MMKRVYGDVWCDIHGCVHDDSGDPYSYGYEQSGETPECSNKDWRKLWVGGQSDKTQMSYKGGLE